MIKGKNKILTKLGRIEKYEENQNKGNCRKIWINKGHTELSRRGNKFFGGGERGVGERVVEEKGVGIKLTLTPKHKKDPQQVTELRAPCQSSHY
jgi:hypothetical protein